MYSLFLISALLCAANAVIDGENAEIEDFPYHVSVEWPKDHFTYDGAIINEHWVLSSGYWDTINNYHFCQIRAGTNTKGQGGTVHQVDKIIRHPGWKTNRAGGTVNELALIHVVEPFMFDRTHQPIGLFEGKLASGIFANATGFDDEKRLKVVKTPVIDFKVCHSVYKYDFMNLFMENMVCAKHGSGVSSVCNGDWGAPLVFEGRLAGIGFYFQRCNPPMPHLPVIFTEVASYRDWIHNQVELPKRSHDSSNTQAPTLDQVIGSVGSYVKSLYN